MFCFFLYSQIELIDRVDDIYRNTTWDNEFKGYGVQIHQVDVCVFVWLDECCTSLSYGSVLTSETITAPSSMIALFYAKSLLEVRITLSLSEFENSILRRS